MFISKKPLKAVAVLLSDLVRFGDTSPFTPPFPSMNWRLFPGLMVKAIVCQLEVLPALVLKAPDEPGHGHPAPLCADTSHMLFLFSLDLGQYHVSVLFILAEMRLQVKNGLIHHVVYIYKNKEDGWMDCTVKTKFENLSSHYQFIQKGPFKMEFVLLENVC